MKKVNLLTLCSVFFLACNNKNKQESGNLLIPPSDSSVFYFPMKQLPENAGGNEAVIDSFVNKWFSEMLFALHEPVLYNANTSTEIYRFTWLRSFHRPIMIRVQKENKEYNLSAKVSDGAGGYQPGKIVIDTSYSISEKEWAGFLSTFNKADFWNSPSLFKASGTDGAEWILEALNNNKYHVVIRWSPDGAYQDFRDCCMYLLKLSGIALKEEDIY